LNAWLWGRPKDGPSNKANTSAASSRTGMPLFYYAAAEKIAVIARLAMHNNLPFVNKTRMLIERKY
ncbi:MAG: hypothetical protein ACRC0C_08850, partial [Gibbsiella quercinecans]|uniref:hypothetical protein n=1 Tax=Gibbsiella quercinecans TaxID=929813 RepID=UPI003F30B054